MYGWVKRIKANVVQRYLIDRVSVQSGYDKRAQRSNRQQIGIDIVTTTFLMCKIWSPCVTRLCAGVGVYAVVVVHVTWSAFITTIIGLRCLFTPVNTAKYEKEILNVWNLFPDICFIIFIWQCNHSWFVFPNTFFISRCRLSDVRQMKFRTVNTLNWYRQLNFAVSAASGQVRLMWLNFIVYPLRHVYRFNSNRVERGAETIKLFICVNDCHRLIFVSKWTFCEVEWMLCVLRSNGSQCIFRLDFTASSFSEIILCNECCRWLFVFGHN